MQLKASSYVLALPTTGKTFLAGSDDRFVDLDELIRQEIKRRDLEGKMGVDVSMYIEQLSYTIPALLKDYADCIVLSNYHIPGLKYSGLKFCRRVEDYVDICTARYRSANPTADDDTMQMVRELALYTYDRDSLDNTFVLPADEYLSNWADRIVDHLHKL